MLFIKRGRKECLIDGFSQPQDYSPLWKVTALFQTV